MPPENLHITLFFIGKVEEPEIPSLSELLSRIGSSTKPFSLQLERYCYAPEGKPRMIWAQFETNVSFTALANTIKKQVGFLREDEEKKEPLPHATLARMKHLPATDRLKLLPAPSLVMSINSFNLYESLLSSSGSHYAVMSSFPMHPGEHIRLKLLPCS